MIKLIVADIDGSLTPGDGLPLDLKVLERVGETNRRARTDPLCPAVTLASGRPQAYVEAMLQAIDAHLPGSFENGAGLFWLEGQRYAFHPQVSNAGRRQVAAFMEFAQAHPQLILQLGKVASATVYPKDLPLAHVETIVRRAVEQHRWVLEVDCGPTCINVLIPGVSKRQGAQWLMETVGVTPLEAAALGDAAGDVGLLEAVGLGVAPANAQPEARAAAHYCSAQYAGWALVELIERCRERNKEEAT
ncbi:MAG: HAD family phosphatase [Deinococcus sp.]|nr:HAD family phosphatase [Deinococcus sp.]